MKGALALLIVVLVFSVSGNVRSTELESTSVLVHCVAISITGKPLANVRGSCQSYSRHEPEPYWHSGKDGKFVLNLKPGRYKMWARGNTSKAIEFSVSKDDILEPIYVISSPHNGLLLKFESHDGKALSNTRIRYGVRGMQIGTGSLETDANGFVVIRDAQGPAPLKMFFVVRRVGYANLKYSEEETLYNEEPVVVRLHDGGYISGRVVSSNGTPIGGIPIYPGRKSFEGDEWSMWESQFGFKSYSYTIMEESMAMTHEGDGKFSLGPLPPGNYRLQVGLSDSDEKDLIKCGCKDVVLPTDRNLDNVRLVASIRKPTYKLQGHVYKSNKTPLAFKEITIEVSGQYVPGYEPENWYVWEPVPRSVVTDAQGKYSLYPFRPGEYKLKAKWNKTFATKKVSVKKNTTGCDFILH